MSKDIEQIKSDIKDIKDILRGMDKRYASKLVENIVYGAIGLIATAVFTSLIYLVVNK